MASGFSFWVVLLLSVWSTATCDQIPSGVRMECRDRYFMIAVDLSLAGEEPHFEAVDGTGVYPITEQYAAECGYTVSVLPLQGHMEFRASYFSCQTGNKDDKVFAFSLNLIATHEDQSITYALNETCSPLLPWSPREVTCEANYMEVSVKNTVTCPNQMMDDWNAALKPAYASAASDWQVMFQNEEEQTIPVTLSEARAHGYMFDLTEGRIVFRTPHGQPDSVSTEVNGVPVEVVHAILFSRKDWAILMVDLVAACSMSEGSYDEGGYMEWETPEVLQPLLSGLTNTQINLGANGELVEQPVAEQRGYDVDKHNGSVEISIPYNAEGGYRRSFVSGELYEYYVFRLYLEQISVHEDHIETRLRYHRTLSTPLLPHPVFTENRTVLEEKVFTIYLGDVPEDVQVSAIQLNGHTFISGDESSITKVVHPNNTHGYTLKVPFDDPAVIQKFSKEENAMEHILEVNFTLTVLPEDDSYFHLTSVTALLDVSPPQFDAVCSESGIRFKLDHRPYDYLWYFSIGSEMLTPQLATQRGYVMSNNSQILLLDVPLFTEGFLYEDVALKGFLGTFEILIRDHEKSEVQHSTVKTCPFTPAEFILCSNDGRMTVLADLSVATSSGGIPARSNLLNTYCGPKEADDTRALFSFPLNSCGSVVKLGKEYVTYENEISLNRKLNLRKNPSDFSHQIERVKVQCTYPLAGLHRLFSVHKFDSDYVGIGNVVRSSEVLQTPSIEVNTVLQTPLPPTRRTNALFAKPGQYIKVATYLKNLFERPRNAMQTKVRPSLGL